MSQKDALTAARGIMLDQRASEAERLNRIYRAMHPDTSPGSMPPSVQIPADAPPLMRELARKADSNYLPLLVKTFRQVIKVDDYLSKSDDGKAEPWAWWQRQRMDSRQAGLVDGVLTYGAAYATVLPGTWGRDEQGPVISCYSPREMTALYQDPGSDEWPMLTLGRDGYIVTLMDEEARYRFGIEPSSIRSLWQDPNAQGLTLNTDALTFIDYEVHDTGFCPVVRYLDRNLLSGEESFGIVEPLMVTNERITEATFQEMVKSYSQAFLQRYVLGWVPKTEQEELKASAARIWYLDENPSDVTIGQLTAGVVDMTLRESAIRDFAAKGQIPAQALGVDGISNISDATLAGLEAAKNRETSEIKTSLGESHEQLMRLCAFRDGNVSAANDYSSEVRWRDFEARSFAATVDGLVKLVTGLGLAPEIALEDVPGMSGQRLERATAAMKSQRARDLVAGLRAAAPAAQGVTSGNA